MQPTNPESMTTDERTTEIVSILALGIVHAVRSTRFRVSHSPQKVSESSPEALENPEDAGLSVSALGPIGGPEPEPGTKTERGDSRDRSSRNRDR